MDEEQIADANQEDVEQTQSNNPFWPFIPAGITWFIGLFFIQGVDHIFIWWTLVCGWFPLFYAMKRKYPAAQKKWNIANGVAVTFLLVIPFLFSLLYIVISRNI